jgi:general secretion pathway protein C
LYSDNLFKIINDARLVFAVTLALVVMLGLQLSSLLWQFVPLPVLPEMSRDDVNRPSQTVQQPQLDARQKADRISAQHLFGQVRNDAPVVEQKIQDAPTSTLKYKLRGIFFSSDQALASVILEKNANDEEFYRLGDEVDRNIFIEQIQPDHIIINRNGRLEKLVMEKPTAELNAKMASLPAARQTDAQATAVLRNYKRRYKDNPMALARRFQAQPVYQDGKNIGYKLKALRGERLLQQLNLKPDDVFVAVNGIGLDKPFQALDALKSLTTAEDVSLTVLRDGSEQTLDFTLN